MAAKKNFLTKLNLSAPTENQKVLRYLPNSVEHEKKQFWQFGKKSFDSLKKFTYSRKKMKHFTNIVVVLSVD
jgi:hypothetical protein